MTQPSLFPQLQCDQCGADMVDMSNDRWIGTKCSKGCWSIITSRARVASA